MSKFIFFIIFTTALFGVNLNQLEIDCKASFNAKCEQLGKIYKDGLHGVKQDTKKAIEYLTKACDGHNAKACGELGEIYYYSYQSDGKEFPGFNDNPKFGLEYTKKACDMGNKQSCSTLSEMKAIGFEDAAKSTKVSKKPQENSADPLVKSYNQEKKICYDGDLSNCIILVDTLKNGNYLPNFTAQDAKKIIDETRPMFEKSCILGDVSVCYTIAEDALSKEPSGYVQELNGGINFPKVIGYLTIACQKRSPNACKLLGDIYSGSFNDGKNIIKTDRKVANEYYQLGMK